MDIVLLLGLILGTVSSLPFPDSSGEPGYGGVASSYVPPKQKGMPYSFAYEVVDPANEANFGHRETSDGTVVEGEYRVLLPDGRTQVVR
jgi:hypothetical protein